MILFPIAVDCISVLAAGTDRQRGCWKRHYSTLGDVIEGLQKTGMVTTIEATELQTELNFVGGCPFFKGSVELEDLEGAGFFRVVPGKMN
jgi:hypothetical protein